MSTGNPGFRPAWWRSQSILCARRKIKAKCSKKCLVSNANSVGIGKFGGDKQTDLDLFERNIN